MIADASLGKNYWSCRSEYFNSVQSEITVTSWLFEAETRKESLLTGVIKNSAAKTFSGSSTKRKKTSQLKHGRLAASPPSQPLTPIPTWTPAVCLTLLQKMSVNVRGIESWIVQDWALAMLKVSLMATVGLLGKGELSAIKNCFSSVSCTSTWPLFPNFYMVCTVSSCPHKVC